MPERYAIHKLIVSQLRGTVNSKAAKDLRQAATLIEAVVEHESRGWCGRRASCWSRMVRASS